MKKGCGSPGPACPIPWSRTLEWAGAVTGLLGAGLLALNAEISGWGFVAFLMSNGFWLGFAVVTRAWGLFAMQVGFTATSVIGIWRWLVAP